MTLREFFISNTWWGKIIGAFFGHLIAGPVGALFGIFIGNFFDRGLAEHFSRPYWYYHQEKRKHTQRVFFTTTFLVIGYVAKADGRISEREIAIAKELMNDLRLSKKQKETAKQYFNKGKLKDFNLNHSLNELLTACGDNGELIKLFLDIQYRAAMAEGMSATKINALDKIFRHLGFAPLHNQYRFYEEFAEEVFSHSSGAREQTYQHRHHSRDSSSHRKYQSSSSTLQQAYAILEVSPGANKQDVKKSYRRLISRNHPDKLIARGLPEEMIKIANDKTQCITKAYEQICRSKGW